MNAQEVIEYWGNDSLKLRGKMVNGERQGFWQQWHQNGKIRFEGNYKNGVLDGEWLFYCKHGYTEKAVNWKDGICFSIVDHFRSGEPSIRLNFKNGITPQEYLKCNEILEWCIRSQLRFKRNQKENDSTIHYRFWALNLYDERRYGANYSVSEFVPTLDSVDIIENMKDEYLLRFCQSLDKEFEYMVYYDSTRRPSRIVKRYIDAQILDLKIEYYSIEPYSVYEESYYLNNQLLNKVRYDLKVKRKNTCSDYYPNGKVKSIINFENGIMDGWAKYFSYKEELVRKEKYEQGILVKTKEY